ncbi:MAG: transcription antitermination factor NusB [Rhodospirillales bacterium CG15_BIG_FIL_POST_REV_8_21_14_020_66_15]|nr:MAG: transcription antitermination factor NusB [Rhodospirillales bacterium CG15_BIG_FIL_POST_REV_8_21_14_020_66_15]
MTVNRSAPLSAARLAAVQALYEMDLAGAGADPVLEAIMAERWSLAALDSDGGDGNGGFTPPDQDLLKELVAGVSADIPGVDRYLKMALNHPHTVESLETLLRAVLRAAAYEMAKRPQVPAVVVIKEYVDVADAFFDGREPALVNGFLDSLGRQLRPAEFT